METGDDFRPAVSIPELRATNRWEAIAELVDALVRVGRLASDKRDSIVAAVTQREKSMSTGIGRGVAIPHAETEVVSEFVGATGHSRKGIDFEAVDGQPVNRVMLFLVPKGQFQKHVHALAAIAKHLAREISQ